MTLIVKVSPADKARTCQGNSPVKASQANSSRATRTKVIRNNLVRTSQDARILINQARHSVDLTGSAHCAPPTISGDYRMDKDQAKGAAKEVKGGVKEAFGKATDNPKTEAEGKVEKNVGTAQRKVGDAKEAVRDAVKSTK